MTSKQALDLAREGLESIKVIEIQLQQLKVLLLNIRHDSLKELDN